MFACFQIHASLLSDKNIGVHGAPPGRVTGMSNTRGPYVVPAHQDYQAYFSGRTVPMGPPSLPSMGYSAVHSQYQDARKEWSGLANRGPSSNILASGMIMVAYTASYETFTGRGKAKSGFGEVLVCYSIILSRYFIVNLLFD